jgi:proteasome lid subunit RPN8/RPN11
MVQALILSRQLCEEMVTHLQRAYPLEGCGILAGHDGVVERLYRVTNVLQSPTAFEMDPHEQLRSMLHLEDNGLEMLAIYHSHPMGPEYPSPSDVAQAYYPDAAHIIVSFAGRGRPQIRAFTIADREVNEIQLRLRD